MRSLHFLRAFACVLGAAVIAGCSGSSGTPDPVREKVRAIVAKSLNMKAAEVSEFEPLRGPKLGADDLDVVEITMGLEDEFGITINDAEIGGIGSESVTVDSLTALVRKKTGGR